MFPPQAQLISFLVIQLDLASFSNIRLNKNAVSDYHLSSINMISRPIDTTAQLLCLQKGGPFEIKRMPLSTLGSDQVLIRQRAIGLNGLDYKQRDWGLHISQWPHVLGVEGAGVIEAIGPDVKTLRVGDEVYAWEAGMAHGASWGGAYQEYVVMPACYVAKKPKNISIEEAASLP